MTVEAIPAGTRIEIRDEEWLVRRAVGLPAGGFELHVTGLSELVTGHQAVFLTPLDAPRILRPEDTELVLDTSPEYRQARLYLDALLRRTPAMDEKLHIGPCGAINPAPYQLEPARMALASPRPRLLMADAVGLGKTIEVGIAVSELIQRGRGDRILCLAKKSMLAQLQQELWSRFSIPLVRLDSIGIARLRSRIPTNKNPFACYNRIIISIDTLKETRTSTTYRHYLESFPWDIVIIDEAHNCANAGTSNNELAHRVCRNAEAVFLTTATPHNGRPRSFAELIRLLNPAAIRDPENYTAEEIAPYFIRRFKKDVAHEVGEYFRDRKLHTLRQDASPDEEAIFTTLGELRLQALDTKRKRSEDRLLRYILFKTYLSSPEAAAGTLATRIKEAEKRIEDGTGSHLEKHLPALRDLHTRLARQSITGSTRYQAFLEHLRASGFPGKAADSRILCFTESRRTQEALAEAIRKEFKLDEDTVVIMHGGLPDVDQARIVDDFGKGDTPVRLLIATDVASEGVNLHYFCHHLVHYELPWSLIRLEQRNGRIDRYLQKEEPHIHYLLVDSACPAFAGDKRILAALVEKEDWVYRNTGDAAGVMRFHDPEKETEAIGEAGARGADPEAALSAKEDAADPEGLMERLLTAATRLRDEEPAYGPEAATFTSPWPRLYEDEKDWLRAAWAAVFADQADAPQPDWHPQRPECELKAPDELKERCGGSTGKRNALIPGATAIPDEAFPKDWTFRLSTDREAIMKAIDEARKLAQAGAKQKKTKRGRKKKDAPAEESAEALAPELRSSWPELHLLWEQHPVCQWLLDRLLIHFGRGQAPLVISSHLGPSETMALFRGAMANKNGREVVVDWFAVCFDTAAAKVGAEFAGFTVLPLADALAKANLAQLARTGKEADCGAVLQAFLPPCVEAATAHMRDLRRQRGQTFAKDLTAYHNELDEWAGSQYARLDKRADRINEDSPVFAAQMGRLKQEREKVRLLVEAEAQWLSRTMTTSAAPVLQLALVIAGTGVTP